MNLLDSCTYLLFIQSFQKRYAADAFLVLYSVVDKSTFQYAETELTKLHDSNILINKPAILVANKIDLARSRTVSTQGKKYHKYIVLTHMYRICTFM